MGRRILKDNNSFNETSGHLSGSVIIQEDIPGNNLYAQSEKVPIGFAGLQSDENMYAIQTKIEGETGQQKNDVVSDFKPEIIFDSTLVKKEPVLDPLLIAGMIAVGVSIASFPVIGPFSGLLLLAGLSLIIVSLIRIKHHPEKYKGKNLAITLLITAGTLIVLSSVFIILFVLFYFNFY
jgi:membrane-associated HD superfamily phosphohydrolase